MDSTFEGGAHLLLITDNIMKNTLLIVFLVIAYASINAQTDKEFQNPNETQARWDRYEYDLMRFMDPHTGCIPENIRYKEIQFAKQMANTNLDLAKQRAKGMALQNVNWTYRGPANIGGRTYALAIDVANENIILAGSTSGGMWRSTDRGTSWQRTTPLLESPSTASLVQDTRPGKTNTWYYGTGEMGNTAAYPLWLNDGPYKWGDYNGNGIYKSTDNGISWNVLQSTVIDSIGGLIQPFNVVNALAIDPSNDKEDIIYAAVSGGIERSSDGGETWTMVLGSFPPGSLVTNVAVTSGGVVYAALGTNRPAWDIPNPDRGFYRSTDGINWTNITPRGWQSSAHYISIAIAPSNENVVYMLLDSALQWKPSAQSTFWNCLWQYTYISGDGTGDGGKFEERSANLSKSGVTFSCYVKVKPDDENSVFVGGLNLVASTDGFASSKKTIQLYSPHVDQNSMAFFPSNPDAMVIGCDGGLFFTANNLSYNIKWISLNNSYATTQFYTVAIDHSTPGDKTIVGGMQDNNTYFTSNTDATKPWKQILGGDGAYCAIAKDKSSYYASYQWGMTYRYYLDSDGNKQAYGRIDPLGGENYLFINPFCLDPNNTDRMYLGGGNVLWRNDSLFILMNGTGPTSVGWKKLTNTEVSAVGSYVLNSRISYIAASKAPANRVYYGTSDGQVFRMDDANVGNPIPTPIWESKGLPTDSYVSSIAIDPENADNVLIAFANYNVISLFYTSNGGNTWTPVGGNLEEYPNGAGSGPACRTVAILHSGDGIIYLVGTSIGLFSTSYLNGMSTVWSLEGEDKIGNNIVNMIDVRDSDGMVAVATCGAGMFSGNFEPAVSVRQANTKEDNLMISPNPAKDYIEITLEPSDGSTINIYNILGEKVMSESIHPMTGSHRMNIEILPQGIYYLTLKTQNTYETKKFEIVK
jgi:hypothetical protein